jgi:hypothetical protein
MHNKTGKIANEDIANVWLKSSTLLASENSKAYDDALYELKQCGVSLRALEEITGIPKSTLSWRFNQRESCNDSFQRQPDPGNSEQNTEVNNGNNGN